MTSITMQSKKKYSAFGIILAIAFWTLVWEAASVLINDNLKLFLPSPFAVVAAFFRLVTQIPFWESVLLTLIRIFGGFVLGIIGGVAFGILTSNIKILDILISPAMRIIRAVPVVSFIILAYLFINVNFLPVFICSLMVMPLIWQTVHDELCGFDVDLTEMAQVFGIKGYKNLVYIKLASISGKIISAMVNGIGLAWKSGVATEVLCTPAISLGRNLYRAKGNINYDEVYAITLTVVILSIAIEYAIRYSYHRNIRRENDDD